MERIEKKFYELTAAEGKMLYDGETYAIKVSTATPDKWQEVDKSQHDKWLAEQKKLATEAPLP